MTYSYLQVLSLDPLIETYYVSNISGSPVKIDDNIFTFNSSRNIVAINFIQGK